jgi:hypothetical protein
LKEALMWATPSASTVFFPRRWRTCFLLAKEIFLP